MPNIHADRTGSDILKRFNNDINPRIFTILKYSMITNFVGIGQRVTPYWSKTVQMIDLLLILAIIGALIIIIPILYYLLSLFLECIFWLIIFAVVIVVVVGVYIKLTVCWIHLNCANYNPNFRSTSFDETITKYCESVCLE